MPARHPAQIKRTLSDAAALICDAKRLLEASAEAVQRSRRFAERMRPLALGSRRAATI